MSDPGFQYAVEDLSSLRELYRNCDRFEDRILHQIVHDPARLPPDDADKLPERYRRALKSLEETELLDVGADQEFVVPPDLVYLPEGPGIRADQFSGVLHRLPESCVRHWLESTGEESVDEMDTLVVYRRLASTVADAVPEESIREDLESVVESIRWTSRNDLSFELPESLDDVYRDLEPEDNPLDAALLTGWLLPTWDEALETTGVFRSKDTEDQNGSITVRASEETHGNEKDWDRSPFDLAEQLKILLLVNDALPLRLTEDDSPHRFDLKEAARITDWDLEHVDYLTEYLIERNLLRAGDERFLITERYRDWEEGTPLVNPLLTGLVPDGDEEDSVTQFHTDLSFGFLLRAVLRILDENPSGLTLEDTMDTLVERPEVRAVLAARPGFVEDYDQSRVHLVEETFERLYQIGLCDRYQDQRRYRINERGERLLEEIPLELDTEEDLPLILQPDGQLMLPLECPIDSFRHVNPFGLIVKVDRMIVYQIDDKSLVQALNEGWDARGFREFLEENVRELPNPMEELFDDILEDVEDVSIESVHHLLQFETGATAAKAMNVLNNYEPSRIDECTVVLRSKTTEETIRRNLSRGGIRLRQEGSQGVLSPVIDAS